MPTLDLRLARTELFATGMRDYLQDALGRLLAEGLETGGFAAPAVTFTANEAGSLSPSGEPMVLLVTSSDFYDSPTLLPAPENLPFHLVKSLSPAYFAMLDQDVQLSIEGTFHSMLTDRDFPARFTVVLLPHGLIVLNSDLETGLPEVLKKRGILTGDLLNGDPGGIPDPLLVQEDVDRFIRGAIHADLSAHDLIRARALFRDVAALLIKREIAWGSGTEQLLLNGLVLEPVIGD